MAVQSPFHTNYTPRVGTDAPDTTKTERNAPSKVATDNVPEAMSRRGMGPENPRTSHYGRNGYAGPSSLAPGERTEAAGARLATTEDVDLNAIQDGAYGAAGQTRALDKSNVPTHSAMAKRGVDSGSPGGTVPAKTGASVGEPVRKP